MSASDSRAESVAQTFRVRETLPKRGLIFSESQSQMILCKPKLLPLKSVTLQKLEAMQEETKNKVLSTQQSL